MSNSDEKDDILGFDFKSLDLEQIVKWLAEHIKSQNVKDWLPYIVVGYLGWNGAMKASKNDPRAGVKGAAAGMIFLRLAESPNLAAAGVGLAGLASIGILNLPGTVIPAEEGLSVDYGDYPILFESSCPDGYTKTFDRLHGIYWCKKNR